MMYHYEYFPQVTVLKVMTRRLMLACAVRAIRQLSTVKCSQRRSRE